MPVEGRHVAKGRRAGPGIVLRAPGEDMTDSTCLEVPAEVRPGETDEILRAALEYAELGLRVFPVRRADKEPHTKGKNWGATRRPERIHELFGRQFPGANIGLVMGHGFV